MLKIRLYFTGQVRFILKNFKFDLSNKNKKLIPQVLTILFILLAVIYFTINAQNNMGNRGISFGFGFLSQESSFDIAFSLIEFVDSVGAAL